LDSPEIAELIADLEATRWTGRPGYPIPFGFQLVPPRFPFLFDALARVG
jgi:hypothetical protein